MKNSFIYEVEKTKRSFRNLFLWILIVQTISLFFFTIVGKFEMNDSDTILKTVSGITTLSTTVTLTIVTIYAVMIVNKVLVIKYIGDFRERTYIYPSGRSKMFRDKIYAFFYNYMIMFVGGTVLINTLYYIICSITSYITITIPIYIFLLNLFNLIVLALFISVVIILISIIIGLYYQSTNKSLITSIILISFIGNIVANTYRLNTISIILINICLIMIILGLAKFLENHIRVDNLLRK